MLPWCPAGSESIIGDIVDLRARAPILAKERFYDMIVWAEGVA